MNKNILILVFLALMFAFGIYSWTLFKEVQHQKSEVVLREEKLKSDSVKNVLIQRERDSVINLLLKNTVKNNPVLNDSLTGLIKEIKNLSDSSAKLNDAPTYQASRQAAVLEREGFIALSNNQFDVAMEKFTKAESISPSFHMAYEISNLLKREQKNFDKPEAQKSIKLEVVQKYSWRAPRDAIFQLKEQTKDQPEDRN